MMPTEGRVPEVAVEVFCNRLRWDIDPADVRIGLEAAYPLIRAQLERELLSDEVVEGAWKMERDRKFKTEVTWSGRFRATLRDAFSALQASEDTQGSEHG